jgi:hypothetical protein
MALFGWWFMLVRSLSLSLSLSFFVAVFWSRIIIKRFYKFTIDGNPLLFLQPSHYVVMKRRIYSPNVITQQMMNANGGKEFKELFSAFSIITSLDISANKLIFESSHEE